jgi:uncharacterized repeat protein (TIGR01451 family)
MSFSPASSRAATPGGTLIHNVATVTHGSQGTGPASKAIGYDLLSGPTTVVVMSATELWSPLRKSVEPEGQVPPGTMLLYRGTFGNAGPLPATNVVIADNLDAHLAFVEGSATLPAGLPGASVAYDPGTRTVRWTVPSVPAGYTGQVTFRAAVEPSTPSDSSIPNAFGVTCDQVTDAAVSNTVTTAAVEQALRISMTASRSEAEIGDTVVYIVRVENGSDTMTVDNVVVTGVLPFGFRYAKGTSSLDNAAVADPAGGTRPAWRVGSMAPGAVRIVKFRAILTGDAVKGDGVGRAYAAGRSPGGNTVSAGPAQYRVKVTEGVLGSRGVILGRVFHDRDGDRMPGEDEPGFAGVRLYLEDGAFAETDREGKYSILGIRKGEHVLKLDRSTLPPGMVPVPLDGTFAGDGGSRFVSLPFGGSARGDFALRHSPAIGDNCLPVAAAPENPGERTMTFGTATAAAPPSLEAQIGRMPRTPEILEPQDGASLARPYSDIAVRVPEGAAGTLRVNGEEVPRKAIGKEIHESERKLYIYRYIGVKLSPGTNTIALETETPGAGKSVRTVTVTVPGPPARILLSPEKAEIGADGREPVPFAVTLVDAFGKPSLQEQVVTVVLDRGKVSGADLDASTPGHQLRAAGGRASFSVRGTGESGPGTLKVLAGSGLAAGGKLFFVPQPRPWVVAGIADVTAGANRAGGNTAGATGEDAFKDGFVHDGRVAVFARGSVGDYLVTGSYDTGKEKTEPLFQETDPAKYYPMTGDSGKNGFDAPSGDKLFLKAERGRSYALYGDYRTDLAQTDFARYDRAFTGAKADADFGKVAVKAFGAETGQIRVRDDLRGNGTSGLYFLSKRPVVEGSEQVRIEVRDRYHPERILSTAGKSGFVDYTIDSGAGTILFKEPVPSYDTGMNPVYIVVLYESEGEGAEYYTYGGRAAVRPREGIEVGATIVREDRNLDKATLSGVDAAFAVGKSLKVTGEAAETSSTAGGNGTAWRIEAEGTPAAGTALSAYYRTVDREFENLSAQSAEPGTEKYGAKAEHRLAPSTGLKAEGYVQENGTAGTRLAYLAGAVTHRWDNVAVEAGYRSVRDESDSAAEEDADSGSVYASVTDRFTERVAGTLKHSQIVAGEGAFQYETETAAILEYGISDTVKANVAGNYQWTGGKRKAVLAGLENRLGRDTVLTSRYEIENAASGDRMQSLIGLNHRWSPRKGLKLDGRVEWIESLTGTDNASDGTAVAVAAEYLPREDVKATGRAEVRFGETETTTLFSGGAGWKARRDVGLLARASLWNAWRDEGGNAAMYDVLAGVAYRPAGIRSVYLLDTVRFILERNGSAGEDGSSRRIISSNDISWRVRPRLTLYGKYAGKYAWDSYEGEGYGTYTDLLVAGAAYDLTDRWDVSSHARLMTQYSAGTRELSAVVRAGYRIVKNLYGGAGYNFARMSDGDLDGSGWRSQGPFIELKLKFDEATLHLPGWDKAPEPPPCPPKPDAVVPGILRVDRPIDVVGSVEMPALLVNGSAVALPSGDAVLVGNLPDGSLRFEGSGFYEPVRFRTSSSPAGSPSAWSLAVLDAGGGAVRTLAGQGAPPPVILWDGRAEDGRTVDGGAVYRYRIEVAHADNSVAAGGIRDFAVNRVSAVYLNLTGSAFLSGSDVLSAKARKALREVAEVLGKRPEERVLVEGHTDDVGTEEYNMDLSRRRAHAAAEYLVKECGIPADRFDVLWYGESRPMAPNDTPEGRELNRRVELKGEFQETLRASATDRFRGEPSARVNGAPLALDPAGRFRTALPAETERIDLELVAADGRSVRTSLAVPSIRIDPLPDAARPLPGPAGEGRRITVTGRTEPGTALERDGRPVPVGADGRFSETVDLRTGYARVGFIAKSPAGVTRVLHLDLGFSAARGKEASR